MRRTLAIAWLAILAGWPMATLAAPGETAPGATALAAPPPTSPKVRVELLSEVRSIPAGETFWVALHQRIAPGWHTYWKNPGDSGEPPRIEWELPAGFSAGDFLWPYPERLPVGLAMTFGYSGDVVLPIPVTTPSDLTPGTRITLRGTARWLVCEKECIPEEAPVAMTLPVATGAPPRDPRGATLIAAARRAVPTPSTWPASFTATPETVTLTVAARGLAPERIADVWFFPERWGVIELTAPQKVRTNAEGITIEVARGPLPEGANGPIDGVLVVTERLDGSEPRHAFAVRAEPRSPAVTADPRAPGARADDRPALSLSQAIALALAGGLVLNLMPCVLPVLSVKVLGLVQHAAGERAILRTHGVAYTAGVLISFAAVAGTLIALRAAGEQLGWGFQLQSPVFVTLLACLLLLMALVMSGVVVIGGGLAGAGQALAGRSGYLGSFCTGVLAAVAATPCTAPFMGAAVGLAVTLPWSSALLIFEALGLGLALPYLLLTLVPAWRRFLPAPGPWMVWLKQALAFPLYASVAWLVWVVSRQAGPEGVAAALAGLLLTGFAAWLYQVSRGARAAWRRAATVTVGALAVATVALGGLAGGGPRTLPWTTSSSTGVAGWEPFTPERLAELRARGTPVFVNVTAAWCITCLVNERVALRSPAVREVFARKGVVALKADWTSRDPAITRVLGAHGRSGVPLYLLYPAGAVAGAVPGAPTVLPQILSESTVIEAVESI